MLLLGFVAVVAVAVSVVVGVCAAVTFRLGDPRIIRSILRCDRCMFVCMDFVSVTFRIRTRVLQKLYSRIDVSGQQACSVCSLVLALDLRIWPRQPVFDDLAPRCVYLQSLFVGRDI